MAKLIYAMITSLDGYTEDEHGRFGWGAPDEEVHSYINDRVSSFGTYLYRRKMYDTMVYWETAHPVIVGGGKRFFPNGVRLDLELVEERHFRKGVVLRYAIRG